MGAGLPVGASDVEKEVRRHGSSYIAMSRSQRFTQTSRSLATNAQSMVCTVALVGMFAGTFASLLVGSELLLPFISKNLSRGPSKGLRHGPALGNGALALPTFKIIEEMIRRLRATNCRQCPNDGHGQRAIRVGVV